jgi:phytoene dehydrogenase-like protein
MAEPRDIVIIGGGHNGLVTAFYLAKAGFKPLVLERSAQVGGAAVTDEFHPGFRCSTLAHTAGPILPSVARDMQLEKHGLKLITPEVCVTALSGWSGSVALSGCGQIGAGDRSILPERCREIS